MRAFILSYGMSRLARITRPKNMMWLFVVATCFRRLTRQQILPDHAVLQSHC
jgi:hypothetical protein